MTSSELSSGLLIDGVVRLVRLLGEGGMGSVWVADHLRLSTQVAVKFLSPALAKEPGPIVRFQHEAMMAAQIKSRHVVQIHDQGVFDGERPYIVMELLEGEDLSRCLAREGPLSPSLLARVMAQTCRALGRAHAAGIVHRDVKPDNIFLIDEDDGPFVKVLDFGIAKRTDGSSSMAMTSTGAMVGTPYYMSPEQMLDLKQVDFRADLWSLGVVAYHCLVGIYPFEGKTIGGLCVAIEKGVFEPPSRLRPGLPPALDTWFLRALHRDPASRFDSAREMAEAFVAAVEGTSADGRETKPPASAKSATNVDGSPVSHATPRTQADGSPMSHATPRAQADVLGETLPHTPRARIWSTPEGELENWFTVTPTPVSKTPPAVTTTTYFDGAPTEETPPPEPPPARSSRPKAPAAEARLSRTQPSPIAEAPLSAKAPALAQANTPVSVRTHRAAPPAAEPPDDAPIDDALLIAATVPSPRRTRRNVARLVAFGLAMLATAVGTSALLGPLRLGAPSLTTAGRAAATSSAEALVVSPPSVAPSASAGPASISPARSPQVASPKGALRGQPPAARANAAALNTLPNASANEGAHAPPTRRSARPARASASVPMALFLKAPPEAEPASAPPAPEMGPSPPPTHTDAASSPGPAKPSLDQAGAPTPPSPDQVRGPATPSPAPKPEHAPAAPAASGESLLRPSRGWRLEATGI